MKRGRRPTPTRIKELLGNPGKRPLNKNEPKPEGKAKCPRHLTGEARREWRRVSRELEAMGLLTSVDRAALSAYCLAWANSIRAQASIDRYGTELVIEKQDADGKFHILSTKRNPAVGVLKDMLQLMRQHEVEFGMTPSSRSRVQVPTQVHMHEESNAFTEIAEENRDSDNVM